ncbi:GNAT family N-acetyltransferase [Cohnella sp. JJ-181]|uniref:GNAT family N-acetyltransferase n=1 Tax=Cohnella rhizoplanae TaxID=2974897 RepID=UPI0022FF7C79|nr:GNAT family N-acetyltransferase [Cohnella sp. JJ-181]CAI6087325.1 hypothetical protein COHCIP112018_05451 [Cohnella sp. JJ-181]
MNITIVKADQSDASIIHDMQIKAFKPLLEKYRDYETSPANESIERVIERLNQYATDLYLIKLSNSAIGAIRVMRKESKVYRISPIFILPEHQGKGIAQKVFALIEGTYSDASAWELDTILQERGNCYLYEKLGYQRTGEEKRINDRMTIVNYKKLFK